MPRSAIVNGASPLTISVAGTDPTPTNTRSAVPMNSAPSFWASVGSSMGTSRIGARYGAGEHETAWHETGHRAELHSTMSNPTRKLRPGFAVNKYAAETCRNSSGALPHIRTQGASTDDPVSRSLAADPDRAPGCPPDESRRDRERPAPATVDSARHHPHPAG